MHTIVVKNRLPYKERLDATHKSYTINMFLCFSTWLNTTKRPEFDSYLKKTYSHTSKETSAKVIKDIKWSQVSPFSQNIPLVNFNDQEKPVDAVATNLDLH